MRKRSGGFHCQSLQDFIEAEKQSLTSFNNHKTPLFEDIETYLTGHTDRLSTATEPGQSYYFQEQHQFQAEEEKELSSEGRNTPTTCITISIICEDMAEVQSYLLHPRHIKETFDRIYKGKLQKGQEIKSEVSSHVVNISSREKLKKGEKVHHQNNTSKGAQKSSFKCLKPGLGANNGCFERRRQSELQFIIYNDQVQKKGKSEDGSADLTQRQQIQTKVWLIQSQENYSPLFQTYLSLSHYVFEAHKNGNELNLVQKSKGEQDGQMLRKVEIFDEMLIRISADTSSKAN